MALRKASNPTSPKSKMLQSIDSIVQFADGEKEKWNNVDIPIPKGMVIIATDTLDIKIGNGEDLYKDLPILFSLRTIEELIEKVRELEQKIAAETTVTDHGYIQEDTFQFSLADGYAHKARLRTNNVRILRPVLPEGVESGKSTCILTCATTDTLITFGSNVIFMGHDGPILLNGQSYLYTFSVIESTAYVESRLVPSVIT